MQPCRECKKPIPPAWKTCTNCDKTCLHDNDIMEIRERQGNIALREEVDNLKNQIIQIQAARKTHMNTIKMLMAELDERVEAQLHYKHEMERYIGLYSDLVEHLKTVDKPKRGY